MAPEAPKYTMLPDSRGGTGDAVLVDASGRVVRRLDHWDAEAYIAAARTEAGQKRGAK